MPGGVVHQASETTLAQLRKHAPAMDEGGFQKALGIYSIERRHRAQPPAAVRDALSGVSAAARSLYDQLANASDELLDILTEECAAFGDAMMPERLKPMLLRLSGLSGNARTEAARRVSAGRDMSARTKLVAALADTLEQDGIAPDATATGPLVMAFDIALEALQERVADSADTVRKALASIRKE